MIDSILPSSVRAGNLYIGRAPYGSRPVINITPGTFQGSARAPKGSRPVPLDTVRCPLYLLTKIGEKESRGARPFAGRSPGGPLMQPAGSFTGCLRATDSNKTPGELGAASSTHRRPYGFLKIIVPAPEESEGSRTCTVRKWPKYPFLLAVRGPGVICESPLRLAFHGRNGVFIELHVLCKGGSMGLPSLNDLAVDGTLNTTNQPTSVDAFFNGSGYRATIFNPAVRPKTA